MSDFWHNFKISLRTKLIAGGLALMPIAVTVYFIKLFIGFFDNIVSPVLDPLLGVHLPGLGLLISFLLIYLLGLLVTNFLGKRLLLVFEKWLNYIPVARSIYQTTKQVLGALSVAKSGFEKVVFLEYPRKGVWTLGFVTGELPSATGRKYYNVFLPTTPNPTSGWVLFVPENEVIPAELSIEQSLKVIMSGGAVTPPQLNLPDRASTCI